MPLPDPADPATALHVVTLFAFDNDGGLYVMPATSEEDAVRKVAEREGFPVMRRATDDDYEAEGGYLLFLSQEYADLFRPEDMDHRGVAAAWATPLLVGANHPEVVCW